MSLNLISHPVMSINDRHICTHSIFSTFRATPTNTSGHCVGNSYSDVFYRMPFDLCLFQGEFFAHSQNSKPHSYFTRTINQVWKKVKIKEQNHYCPWNSNIRHRNIGTFDVQTRHHLLPGWVWRCPCHRKFPIWWRGGSIVDEFRNG